MASFYQDRLGINIGKVEKRVVVSYSCSWVHLRRRQQRWRLAVAAAVVRGEWKRITISRRRTRPRLFSNYVVYEYQLAERC
jgi:hypothetical protein